MTDPLRGSSDPDSHWDSTNLSEAFPGVLTPLDWAVVGPAVERGTRGALHAIGALSKSEAALPDDPDKRAFGVFYGRIASRMEFFHALGARMPGTTPDAVVEQIFGVVPEGMVSRPSPGRYPIVAARFPLTFALAPRRTQAMRRATRKWWASEVERMRGRNLPRARAAFNAALARLDENLAIDGIALLAGTQPIYDQLSRFADDAGMRAATLMQGYGSHEEGNLVSDLWACSRGQVDLAELVRRYGYHGPREGVLSGEVWRERTQPLEALVARYADMPSSADPDATERERLRQRLLAEEQLIAGLPASKRPAARLLLRLAHTYVPLRGKAARTQALDVARAAARRIGECLAEQEVLADPSDAMFLTANELGETLPDDVRELVTTRRAAHEEYQKLDLPSRWQGDAIPVPLESPADPQGTGEDLEGIGASSGIAEGRVCVLMDPSDDAGLEHGDILVTRTTDPSWAAVMFLSSGLVVDIGGLLSHAAIVARELGVPCVMGTQTGTRTLRTGDVCRVDGGTGRVEIVKRAADG